VLHCVRGRGGAGRDATRTTMISKNRALRLCDGEFGSCGWPTAVLVLARVTTYRTTDAPRGPMSRPDVSVHGEAFAGMGGRSLPPVARYEAVRLTAHRRRGGVRADR
jgi:hypothetical protein